jgi:tRNA threonylcarbamoyladenosine biosynthesis protein TsaB
MILCLETATSVCSAALCDRSGILSVKESHETKSHAAQLTLFIGELIEKQGIKTSDLEAVAVSKGPGSYTGLRIGVSTAKGIAFASSVPIIGIDTTLSMFYGMKSLAGKYPVDAGTLFCPMLDAKRMEVYHSLFNAGGTMIKGTSASVITKDSFSDIPESVRILFFGDGAGKCKNVISHKNSIFVDDFRVSATYMHVPAYEAFNSHRFEDIAYFEPLYLKDFITTTPKKNLAL